MEYVSDLLVEKRRMLKADATRAGRSIAAHADLAISFLEQAFAGREELSFLPIYYALANLSKALIVADGRIEELRRQRYHGASWSGITTRSHDLNTDHITLMSDGTIPLLYQTLTGEMWSSTRQMKNGNWVPTKRRKVFMRNVYPYILSIGYEYHHTYGGDTRILPIGVIARRFATDKVRIEVKVPAGLPKSDFRILSGLQFDGEKYVSHGMHEIDLEAAATGLARSIRRFLLYDAYTWGRLGETQRAIRLVTFTPVCNSTLLLPEELPILLAYFHLSNVVRYDPERLLRLFDSHAAGLLHTFVRQGVFRFLVLFWSNLMQASYVVF